MWRFSIKCSKGVKITKTRKTGGCDLVFQSLLFRSGSDKMIRLQPTPDPLVIHLKNTREAKYYLRNIDKISS